MDHATTLSSTMLDTKRKVLFLVTFMTLSVGLVLFFFAFGFGGVIGGVFNLFAGLVAAASLGSLLGVLYLKSTRKEPRPSMHPGELECPECRSLQTDRSSGSNLLSRGAPERWMCFNCDNVWEQ